MRRRRSARRRPMRRSPASPALRPRHRRAGPRRARTRRAPARPPARGAARSDPPRAEPGLTGLPHRRSSYPVVQGESSMAIPMKLRAPGWYRAALFNVIGFAFAFGLTVLVRALMHEHPVVDGNAITIVSLIAIPLFFLGGLGVGDYWFYWAFGRKPRAEDHSQHGAYSWRDYFRV